MALPRTAQDAEARTGGREDPLAVLTRGRPKPWTLDTSLGISTI